MKALVDFCFSQPGLVLIPIEELSPQGMSEQFAGALCKTAEFDEPWVELFNNAFCLYWARVSELSRQSPAHWFPPRLQHVAVVTRPRAVRPFFQPINASSWLVYASDFDPDSSNEELGAFALVHAEVLGLARDVVKAIVHNLSYWILRDEAECEQFREAVSGSSRPDQACFQSLAASLDWISKLHHQDLRKPSAVFVEPLEALGRTGLIVSREQHRKVDELVRSLSSSVGEVAENFYRYHAARKRDHGKAITSWLKEKGPRLVITGRNGETLWSPAHSGTNRLKTELSQIPERPAASLRKDLETIDRLSSAFLDSLVDPDSLPDVDEKIMDQGGLSYLHGQEKLVAYNVHEANMQRLREPAPPFERPMLAARTIHEWGHLAVDAGWIGVPEENRQAHERAFAALHAFYTAFLEKLPEALRRTAVQELAAVKRGKGDPALVLAKTPIGRMPDFQANLLAKEFLTVSEMETYVRSNVRSLAFDKRTTGLFSRLARYAYEYQYLRFSIVDDPLAWFLESTWFGQQYLDTEVLERESMLALFDLVAKLCDSYEIDRSRFSGSLFTVS